MQTAKSCTHPKPNSEYPAQGCLKKCHRPVCYCSPNKNTQRPPKLFKRQTACVQVHNRKGAYVLKVTPTLCMVATAVKVHAATSAHVLDGI
jgi:hypothetical protein